MSTREEYLEILLQDAVSTIEFLHGCLTNPRFRYDYPGMTEDHLVQLRRAIPSRQWCMHARHQEDCDGCKDFRRRLAIRKEWESR